MLEQMLDQLITEQIEQDYFPGVVIRVVRKDRLLFEKAYGYASTRPYQSKLECNTRFDLASLTKIVMSTIILRLVSQQMLKLEQPVAELLSALKTNASLKQAFSNITLEQLLTHASGLPAWHAFYATEEGFYQQLEYLVHNGQPVEPGTYSDVNFMLVGEIIKEATGLSLREAVRIYLSEPLSMETLTYGPLKKLVSEQSQKAGSSNQIPIAKVAATGFGNATEVQLCQARGLSFAGWRDSAVPMWGEVNDGNAYHYWQSEAGHAGLFGTSEDVSKIGQLYLNQGSWQGEQLIEPALVQRSMTKHIDVRGLGWEFSSIYPAGCGHTGFTGTCLWLHPEADLAVTTLTNRLHVDEPQNIQPFRKACHQLIYEMIGEM